MYSKVYLVDVGQRNALLSQTTLTMTSLFDLGLVIQTDAFHHVIPLKFSIFNRIDS
jgi:hypothetical protein